MKPEQDRRKLQYSDRFNFAFCRKWKITELSFFGSLVRGDFRPDSDIDVLVQYSPDAKGSFFRLVNAQDELSQIFGRRVDLVSKATIERSRNELRRKEILGSARKFFFNEEAA